jgi:glycosyltransferase involved in cell wall biosynthesis
LVKWIYKKADLLLVQSQAFIKPISQYAPENKIKYYPNSCKDLKTSDSTCDISQELYDILVSSFCIVFAGNLGSAQSLETIVNACIKIHDLDAIRVVLVGSGSRKEWLEEQKSVYNLHNLIIAGRYSLEAMPSIYRYSAALLVTLRKSEIFSYTVPSKVQSYLAAGKPILAALDGEGARIIKEANAGLISQSEDSESLAANIQKLYLMSEYERDMMGKSGRDYFLENYELNGQADILEKILENEIFEGRRK